MRSRSANIIDYLPKTKESNSKSVCSWVSKFEVNSKANFSSSGDFFLPVLKELYVSELPVLLKKLISILVYLVLGILRVEDEVERVSS